MKRFFALVAAAALCAAAFAHEVKDLDINVAVNKDGSAVVTQRWSMQVGSENTEWYIPVQNLGPMTIGSLSVKDNGVPMQSLGDNWDVDRSRSWKTGKCGIVRKRDGVELCWGLGDTGAHNWEVSFALTGLVQAYDDADAFNFMFVNPGMPDAPEHVRVTIGPAFECPEWTYDNTRVWAFGFYGDINVKGGKVVAETSEPMGYSSKFINLVKFEKGIFQPAVTKGGAVQDFIDRALEDSSYGEDDPEDKWFLLGFALLFIGGIFLVIYVAIASALGYKWKKSMFGRAKIDGWYRDIPLEGNLFAAEYVLTKGARFGSNTQPQNIIGAFFLRWIMDGKLKVQPDPKSDKRVNLLFEADSASMDDVEEDLFQWALSAAGDNSILEKNEFEKWSTKNYKKMTAWPDRAIARGKTWFRDKGYFLTEGTCTTEGQQQACHLVEFRNFLKDFTLSGERASNEVGLWKDYLVFAQLFGIAEKVAKQFKKLYPSIYEEVARSTGMDTDRFTYMVLWTNSMSTRSFGNAIAKAGNINGTGGHSSFGGGGR